MPGICQGEIPVKRRHFPAQTGRVGRLGGFSSRLGESEISFSSLEELDCFFQLRENRGEKNRFSPFSFHRGGLPKFARNFPARRHQPNQSGRRFTASADAGLPLSKPDFFRDDSAKNPSKPPRLVEHFQQFCLNKTDRFSLDLLEKQRVKPRNLNKRAET